MPRLNAAHACFPTAGACRPAAYRALGRHWRILVVHLSSCMIAVRSIVRGLPLFASTRPRTPLRVFCIMAFDALSMLRRAKPLPLAERQVLAGWLDFAACTNAAFDRKDYCGQERRRTWRMLKAAGLRSAMVEYLRRLRALERKRPAPGSDDWQFPQAAAYREAVVRLSLGMAAAIAQGEQRLDEAIAATYHDADLNLLFRIAMQCQIIDDVLDYSRDLSAGLPSFLTASRTLSQAFESTRLASACYADARRLPESGALFPLRAALFLVSTCASLVLAFGRWRRWANWNGQPRSAPDLMRLYVSQPSPRGIRPM